ncbi:MAG TPA: endonuclease/exonuclease/phosphatase family protein [Micromonosporaceae bacterium]|nr:endonuclease/exonuclease/phosphatase family protein [Micromonosporaceae bacterium]
MPLRVMTYNIKNGGEDRSGGERLDDIIEVIRTAAPDVLALQELRGFSASARTPELAQAVGLRAFLAPSCFGQPVAVLVRPPGRVVAAGPVRRPFHHAAQRVTVQTSAGPLHVVGTHLHPYSGMRRLVEAGWLVSAYRRSAGGLALLMGDLNTLDPWTDHAAAVERLPPPYRGRHLRARSSAVDSRAISRLDRAGLVDLFRHAGRGEPQTAATTQGGGAEFSGMRLDYVFGTPAVAARTRWCEVVRGGAAERASDHYPVLAELDLDLP